jgi:HlyD family secretion protein
MNGKLFAFGTACLYAAVGCGNGADPGIIEANGYVEATEVRLSTKLGGTLVMLALEEGDAVETGAEVARVDSVDLELQLASARAGRALAEAELRLKRNGYQKEDIAVARAELGRAEADLAAARRDLDRFQGLLESGSGTEKVRDDALTRRDISARAAEAAGQRLAKLEAGFRGEEIQAAEARLASAEAAIAILEQQISDAAVTSPVSGVVTESLAEQGELVSPGTVLAVVTDLSDSWLTAYVAETDLGRIRLGQQAEVLTDDGQQRQGTVSWINPRAEFTPKNVQTRDERVKLVYRIKMRLDNTDRLFKPGMPARARLQAAAGAPGAGQ